MGGRMRQVKRWRYYCDFCNKAGGQKAAMIKHEKGCTLNHDRVCGLCMQSQDMVQKPFKELVESYNNGGLQKLREISDNCPACILTVLRFVHDPTEDRPSWEADFDFKKELKEFWQNINEEKMDIGYY
jgi:hypothetical protein